MMKKAFVIHRNVEHPQAIMEVAKHFENGGYRVVFVHGALSGSRIPDIIVVKGQNVVVKAVEVQRDDEWEHRFDETRVSDSLYDEIIYVIYTNKNITLPTLPLTDDEQMEIFDEKRITRLLLSLYDKQKSLITKLKLLESDIKILENEVKQKDMRKRELLIKLSQETKNVSKLQSKWQRESQYKLDQIRRNIVIIKRVKDLSSPRVLMAIWRLYFYLDFTPEKIQKILNKFLGLNLKLPEIRDILLDLYIDVAQ